VGGRRGSRFAVVLVGLGLATTLGPVAGEAHLFHSVYAPRDNQLTRDYLVLVQLAEYPYERFDVAAAVYRGAERVRLKPGGFRTWLRRPLEPGLVFKAGHQLNRWQGHLKAEARRVDRRWGTTLDSRIEAALAARDAPGVRAAFRELFVYLLAELFEATAARLAEPEAPLQLYQFVDRYFTVAHEAYLNLHHRPSALALRATLAAVERALGEPARGIPPAPEAFEQQRRRFLRTLATTLGVHWTPA